MGTANVEKLFCVIIPDILQPWNTCNYNKGGRIKKKRPKTAVFGRFWAIICMHKLLKASVGTT